MEVWKTIPSLSEYEASSYGRIRRVPHEVSMPRGGYKVCGGHAWAGVVGNDDPRPRIRYNGKNYKVSRLVCEAFHGEKPFSDAVAMHIDDDPTNNRESNLKWGTQKENLNTDTFIGYCRNRLGDCSPSSIHRRRASGMA